MIRPQSMEELASYVEHKGKTVFFLQQTGAETVASSSPFCQR